MSSNSPTHINEVMNKDIATPKSIPSIEETQQILKVPNEILYLSADTYVGNPYALLGTVLEVRRTGDKCPTQTNLQDAVIDFSATKIPGFMIDENSKLKEPIKRQSIMVDKKLSVNVSFLNYLSAEFTGESSFSLIVFDQATGLVNRDDDSWSSGVLKWKNDNKEVILDDEQVCYVHAVIGFVQKYIIKRKYTKYSGTAKSGAFGVNLNGELYTSDEDYSLDIRYGLQTVVLKRPSAVKKVLAIAASAEAPKVSEINLLHKIANGQNFVIRNSQIQK